MRSLNKQRKQAEEYFHDKWAKSVSVRKINIFAQFEGNTSPEYKEAIKQLGNVKGKKVLNLGCGLGEEATYLAVQGAKVYAIDMSKEMLNATKKLAHRYGIFKNITYSCMSVEELEFYDENFDCVFGCNILHHVDINKTINETKRVLKPGGIAVFSEPLAYNPLINIYRIMANKVRTDDEHPLNNKDLEKIKSVFPKMIHKEYQLLTLLIFVWFFLGERLHPNKVRYWKKIIIEAEKYKLFFKILYTIDKFILKFFPFIRKYCWVTVIKVQK